MPALLQRQPGRKNRNRALHVGGIVTRGLVRLDPLALLRNSCLPVRRRPREREREIKKESEGRREREREREGERLCAAANAAF